LTQSQSLQNSKENGIFGQLFEESVHGLKATGTHYEKQLTDVSKGLGTPEELVQTIANLETALKAFQSAVGAGLNAVKEIMHLQT
jgi:hypothetical protein